MEVLPSGQITWQWKITILNGKTHYFAWAIFNCELWMSLPESKSHRNLIEIPSKSSNTTTKSPEKKQIIYHLSWYFMEDMIDSLENHHDIIYHPPAATPTAQRHGVVKFQRPLLGDQFQGTVEGLETSRFGVNGELGLFLMVINGGFMVTNNGCVWWFNGISWGFNSELWWLMVINSD